jgi:hypothetical protein
MIIQMGEDEPEEEVESPGTIRHRMLLAEKGEVPHYDEEDLEEDNEMTEDEFEEEELLE